MNDIKLFVVALTLHYNPLVWSNSPWEKDSTDTVELTYEDLLTELNSRRSKIEKNTYQPSDDLLIHAGLGFVSSFSTISVDGQTQSWQQNGLELSVGTDLASQQWYAEGTFRNYG